MGDGVTAAIIGATASAIGSVLTYLVGIRSVRRSVSTSNGGTARTAPRGEARPIGGASRRDGAIARRCPGMACLPRRQRTPAALDAPQPVLICGESPASRSDVSVMNRTQEPDVRILLDPPEHRVLTTEQIVESRLPLPLRMDAAARRPQLRDGR